MITAPRHLIEATRGQQVFARHYTGAEDLAPLLLIHGLGESGLCFEEIVGHPLLALRPRLVPDLPGYGRSPWPERALPLSEQVELLAAWIAEHCSRPPILVGHSMGGVIGQLLAEAHPESVAALVDVDGNLCSEDCTFSGRAVASDFDLFVDRNFRRLLERVYEDGLQQPALRGYYASLRLAQPETYYLNSRELVELSASGKLARRLAALEMPVLYIAGSPGGASEESVAQLTRAGVRRVKIAPSGHWPFIDQPADFAEVLAAFLAEVGL